MASEGAGEGRDTSEARPIEASARRARRRSWALVVLTSGAVAGAAMAATLMLIAEISSEPTAISGVDSSTWTPITAIAAFLFGPGAFHASFAVLPILFGLAAHLFLSVVFGAAGVALIAFALGARPGPAAAAALGFFFGLALEILVLNFTVNAIQADNLVYESLPQWGWWAAHAAYGTTLGLAASRAMYLLVPAQPPPPASPSRGAAPVSAP